ncbi:MAG: hypothetical protein HKN88_10550 [Gammaproteobacteria bacterium]|nr:hypothetical protein [Gammaproteobacteria bacterium]NNC98495.1 hypothetical protein [Gammaproteobacteria bacterium]NNM13476.1 hypothetical protein [Gammaproteobacteria bacterium]
MKIDTKSIIYIFCSVFLIACAGTPADTSNLNIETDKTEYSNQAYKEVNAQEKPEQAKEKLICTTEVKTGTRFSKRVCRTRKELDEMQEQAREQQRGTRPGHSDSQRPAGF